MFALNVWNMTVIDSRPVIKLQGDDGRPHERCHFSAPVESEVMQLIKGCMLLKDGSIQRLSLKCLLLSKTKFFLNFQFQL